MPSSILVDHHHHASGKQTSADIEVHLLPCQVQHTGYAPVKEYFGTAESHTAYVGDKDLPVADSKNKVATFRGRLLNGTEVDLPDGTVGAILSTTGHQKDDKELWEVESSFKTFTHWNFDRPTLPTDTPQRWMEWFEIAKAVHEPVSDA